MTLATADHLVDQNDLQAEGGGEDAHVLGQLVAQRPDGRGNDIADDQGQAACLMVSAADSRSAPAAAKPEVNSAARKK